MAEEISIIARTLIGEGIQPPILMELGQDNQTGEVTSLTLTANYQEVKFSAAQVRGLLSTIELVAPSLYAEVLDESLELDRDDGTRQENVR